MAVSDNFKEVVEEDQSKFSNPDFWKQRFQQNEKSFDWYATMRELKEPLIHIFGTSPFSCNMKVLNVGCGNSDFSAEMVSSFPCMNLCNIDIVETVIQKKKIQYPDQEWIHGDATSMSSVLGNDTFDVVFDKGTLDALLCDTTDSNKASLLLSEMGNVLTSAGLLLIISHKPDRIPLMNEGLQLRVDLIWKCDLSDEAILINAFRSRGVNEKHLRELKSIPSDLLVASIQDWQKSVKNKATRKALRAFLLSRNMQKAATRSSIIYDRSVSDIIPQSPEEARTTTRSDFCYLYVIRKIKKQ